jgi:hypothetical protein
MVLACATPVGSASATNRAAIQPIVRLAIAITLLVDVFMVDFGMGVNVQNVCPFVNYLCVL